MIEQKYKTKSGMIHDMVRQCVLDGEYKPGERLLTSIVAEKYGTSEIPVREAFLALVKEGVLISKPNNGFYVSQISKQEVENIFEVRLKLESLAIFEATKRIGPGGMGRLEKLFNDGKKFLGSEDYMGYWKYNRCFHFAMYEFCGNDVLIKLLSELFDFSARYPNYYTCDWEIQESIDEHRKILDAMKDGNAEYAEALVTCHTIITKNRYIQRLQEVLGSRLGE